MPYFVGVMAALALTVLLSSCAPIAPSISKSSTNRPITEPAPLKSAAGETPRKESPQTSTLASIRYPVSIKRLAAHSAGSSMGVPALTLKRKQIDDFRKEASVIIEFPSGKGPSDKDTHAELEIKLGDLDQKTLKEFKLTLQQLEKKVWSLQVPMGVSDYALRTILERTQSVRISFASKPAQVSIGPAPAPKPNTP